MSLFGKHLESLIHYRRMTQAEYARAVRHPPPFVNQVIHGKRTPPLKQLETWADTLDLSGEERATFLRLALLAHCPGPIQDDYLRLRARVDKLERRVAEYEEKYKT